LPFGLLPEKNYSDIFFDLLGMLKKVYFKACFGEIKAKYTLFYEILFF